MNIVTIIGAVEPRLQFVQSLDRLGHKGVPVTPLDQPSAANFDEYMMKTRFSAVVIQPDSFPQHDVVQFIEHVRTRHPALVFLLYTKSDESFQSWLQGVPDEWQSRLGHYYRLDGRHISEDDRSFDSRVNDAIALMREYLSHSLPNWRDLVYGRTTKVFVSSTAYDMRDLRSVIYDELSKSTEFSPIMSDRGSLVVNSTSHSYDNCLAEVEQCDLFVLIIGGRFGGEYGYEGISITQKEYRVARDRGKPILTFVHSDVLTAKELLKPYFRDGVPFKKSKIVEDERIFGFIDEVRKQVTGNWLLSYYDAAHLMGLLRLQIGAQRQ